MFGQFKIELKLVPVGFSVYKKWGSRALLRSDLHQHGMLRHCLLRNLCESLCMVQCRQDIDEAGTILPNSIWTIQMKLPHKLDEETDKLQTRLCRLVGQVISDYRLIEDGDKVMVCLSGGKDSYGLLDILLVLQRRAPVRFDLVAVNLDQKQPGFPAHVLPDYLTSRGVPFHIETRDTYSIVKRLIPEGQTTCSLCSRLRRGHLYRIASELGATKIALGHHRDDIAETLFLNLFYTGKLKAIPPKLRSKDGRHLVIRPLALVKEVDLERYAKLRAFPIIPCDLCGSQENLKRKKVKAFLREWEQGSPGSSDSIAAALSNIAPSLLMDSRLFDFKSLETTAAEQPDGDAWLDEEPAASY